MPGVPKGYKAWWSYRGCWKEYKNRPGNWKFSFKSGKFRDGGKGGSHPPGRRIRWKINGYQDVIKLKNKNGKIRYQTHLYGKKTFVKGGYKKFKK